MSKWQGMVISTALNDPECATRILGISEKFFTDPRALKIFRVIKKLLSENQPVNFITAMDTGDAEDSAYLSTIINEGYFPDSFDYYIQKLRVEYQQRMCLETSILLSQFAKDDNPNIIETLESLIDELSNEVIDDGFVKLKDVLVETFEDIKSEYENNGPIGLSTGFVDIDYKTNGLQDQDSIIIAARPSMGKTAFALNIANYIGKDKIVAFFSLETSRKKMARRMALSESKVSSNTLKNKYMQDSDWNKLKKGFARLCGSNVFIDDNTSISVPEMKYRASKLKRKQGSLDLIVIDYLQLIKPHTKGNIREQINEISKGIKQMARYLDCPVVTLSQLSRAPELRLDHRPIMSDLKESGAIEQDADIIMFLYRDDYYFPETEKPGIAEVNIVKHRDGETGTVELAWIGGITRFCNLQREDE